MGYIYCITNQINGKQYVGKTTDSIIKRFQEHCNDSTKKRCNKRPLYDAMNKYSIENFIIKELETVDSESDLNEREIYWIEKLQTFKKGYNVTKGGDGSILFDYNKIIEIYGTGISIKETAEKIGCCVDTVSKVISTHNIPKNKIYAGNCNYPKQIVQLDKNNNFQLKIFNSIADAAH